MADFDRDWDHDSPAGTALANTLETIIQNFKKDIEARIQDMVHGFTAGETTDAPGFKNAIFKQQSSAPGTPNADEIELYALSDGTNCGLYAKQEDGYTKQILKKVGTDLNFEIEAADIPADTIDSQHYAAASIDNEHLAADIIDGTKIADDSVDSEHLAAGGIDAEHIGNAFGDRTTEDDNGQTLAASHAYLANQDGFVVAEMTADGAADAVEIHLHTASNPYEGGTRIAKQQVYVSGYEAAVFAPVQSGKYWEVTHNGASVRIYWFPIGTLIKCTDQD